MEHEQQQEAVGKARVPSPQCPRCDSTHTKFCYFNNYSMSQPRYLCKNCRRYWTQGGALRNIPQGGGGSGRKGRRSKRSPTAASSATATATATSDNNSPPQLLLDEELEVEPSITASPMPFGDGPDAPPVLPSLYYNGDGLGGGRIGDFSVPPPFDPQFFYGRNFQPSQQQGYQLIPQPRAPSAISLQGWQYQTQQLNTALFDTTTSITTGPTIPNTAVAAGTGAKDEVYWRGLVTEEGPGGWGGGM